MNTPLNLPTYDTAPTNVMPRTQVKDTLLDMEVGEVVVTTHRVGAALMVRATDRTVYLNGTLTLDELCGNIARELRSRGADNPERIEAEHRSRTNASPTPSHGSLRITRNELGYTVNYATMRMETVTPEYFTDDEIAERVNSGKLIPVHTFRVDNA